mgnify:CR=1 FL=1
MGQRGARNRRAEGAAFGGRHVNFLHLKYFLMVAEELNITRAAERLYISQQSLSNHISNMERELNAIVDAGGEGVDVIVEHPVYGQLTGLLGVRSRYDVAEFVRRGEEHGARPLSALTGGIHLHTVRCPDEKTFRRVRKSLEAENFLLNM